MSCDSPGLIVVEDEHCIVVEPEAEILVVTVSDQGPPGPRGPVGPSGGSTFPRTAVRPLSGHRWVYEVDAERVDYASCDDLTSFSMTLGLTLNAAPAGGDTNVTRRDQVSHEGWAWRRGAVFLGLDGQLTQQLPPEAKFSLVVGFSPEPTVLFIDIGIPFILENSNGR